MCCVTLIRICQEYMSILVVAQKEESGVNKSEYQIVRLCRVQTVIHQYGYVRIVWALTQQI